MYRNIHYNIRKACITLWTWDEVGKRVQVDVPYQPYIFIEGESNPDATSIFNTKLVKKSFKKEWDRKNYISNSGLKRIFYNIPCEQQFLIDTFGSKNSESTFSQYPLKIFYLDIETYSPGEFPNTKIAPDQINVITVYDSITEKFYTWGLGGKNGNAFTGESDVVYVPCKSEAELLQSFIRFWRTDFPDIITGWNSESFDIPYLINRIKVILGEDKAQLLSPIGQLFCRENIITKYGKYEDHWYIKGISHIDYMNIYKKFSKDKRERYTLGFISETELKETKKEVPASDLPSFADNNWQGFCEYNIQDVKLIVKFEEKLHYIEIVRKLAYLGYTTFEQALGTISIVTGAMALKALEKGMIIPTFEHKETSQYEGGYVREPQRGLQDSIVSFDANSLYPNTIISVNISPETKLGKIVNKTKDSVEVRLINGKMYEMPNDKFKEFVMEENVAISKAKIMYSQKKKGFCPELLDGIYEERKELQAKLKKHKQNIKHCTNGSDKYKQHEKEIVECDTMQYTLKILMNSLYGTFGNTYSPFYDIDAAASVTLTGQACIKEAAEITSRYMKEIYGVEKDCTIYGDTDSIYITIKPALTKLGKSLTDSEGNVTKDAYNVVKELEDRLNKDITDWAIKTCNIKDPRFKFKRETICNSGLFLEKKRYILHVLLDDADIKPEPEKEIKYTGVEVVSIKIPKKVKPLIKKISEVMLKTKDYNKTNEAYKSAYDEYSKLDIEDIATPISINNYEKYELKANGLSMGLKTPHHVKASISYNYLLGLLGLDKKYERIKSGDSIKTVYVQKNKYNIDGIAFLDRYPTEFGIEMDRKLMFNKNITPAVERLYEVVGWKLKNPTKETMCDLFELLG